MKITILDKNNSFDKDEKKNIRFTVLKTLKMLNQPKDSEICVSFVNDKTIRELNYCYRNI